MRLWQRWRQWRALRRDLREAETWGRYHAALPDAVFWFAYQSGIQIENHGLASALAQGLVQRAEHLPSDAAFMAWARWLMPKKFGGRIASRKLLRVWLMGVQARVTEWYESELAGSEPTDFQVTSR